MSEVPKRVKKTEADLRAFMLENPSIEESASRLSLLVEDLGGQNCLRMACEYLRPNYTSWIISAGADSHQEVEFVASNGTLKTGSLIDLTATFANTTNTSVYKQTIKVLLGRSVPISEDCEDPLLKRFAARMNPAKVEFTQAANPDFKEMVTELVTKMGTLVTQATRRIFGEKQKLEIN